MDNYTLPQHAFEQVMEDIQSAQEKNFQNAKRFGDFIPPEHRDFGHLNFHIPSITVLCNTQNHCCPGWIPDWGTQIFEHMYFKDLTFQNCSFSYLNFSNAKLKNVKFLQCNLEGVVFDESLFEKVIFEDCTLINASFYKATCKEALFKNNKAYYANFSNAQFEQAQFVNNFLKGTIFFQAQGDLSIQGSLENVVLQDLEANDLLTQPVILVSWDNKHPAHTATKIVKRIQEFDGIPFKFNYKDPEIDPHLLKQEILSIFDTIHWEEEGSLSQQILQFAKQNKHYTEISKIQKKAKDWMQLISGVVIPGGDQDLHPLFYGERKGPKTNVSSDLRRDLFELAILNELEENKLPLLAICRGMQTVNIWKGGSLKQHVEGHVCKVQKYTLTEKSSLLSTIFTPAEEIIGYSMHHQAIDILGKDLTVTALALDSTIKAFEIQGRPFALCLQWHPEFKGDHSTVESRALEEQLSPGNMEIYKKFIEACAPKN